MNKLFLPIIMVALSIAVFAQKSHLIIYSEEGETFQAELNGVLQYSDITSNAMITDLAATSYELRLIIGSNSSTVEKTIHFMNGISEDSYLLKQNRKGSYVLRFQNSVPIDQSPPIPSNRKVYEYKGDVDSIPNEAVYALPGYEGYYACPFPMDDNDFKLAKQSIEAKNFATDKLATAKLLISNNCLLTSQICELVRLFEFESDKLEIAQSAYGSTLDVGNYANVTEELAFESSKEELDEYIRNFRR